MPLNLGTVPLSQLIAGSVLYKSGGTLANWTASSTTQSAMAGTMALMPGLAWDSPWWDGKNIAYLQAGFGAVTLSQTLTTALQNGMTYKLSAHIGRPKDNGLGFQYTLELWLGATVVATAFNHLNLAENSAVVDSLTYSSGSDNPLAGQALKIVLGCGAQFPRAQAYFDSISLTASSGSAR